MMRFISVRTWTTSSKLPRLFALSTCDFPGHSYKNDHRNADAEQKMKKKIIIIPYKFPRIESNYRNQSGCAVSIVVHRNPAKTKPAAYPSIHQRIVPEIDKNGKETENWSAKTKNEPGRIHSDDELLKFLIDLPRRGPTIHWCVRES